MIDTWHLFDVVVQMTYTYRHISVDAGPKRKKKRRRARERERKNASSQLRLYFLQNIIINNRAVENIIQKH